MSLDNTRKPTSATSSGDDAGGSARESAADLIRVHLDNIYSSQSPQQGETSSKPSSTSAAKTSQPHNQTLGQAPAIDEQQWKKYHSAWQDYYQQYYRHYYTGYAHQVIKQHTAKIRGAATPDLKPASEPLKEELPPIDAKKQELAQLREKLVSHARQSAKKARRSRHFVPIAAAVCVVLVFAFLQYNRILISNVQAYISPGAIDPQNIIVDPNADVAVSPDPKLIIPKINVNVPVVYGIGASDKEQQAAMENGVAHWPGSDWAKSVPGQAGNTVIAGHSSNDLFESGDYKFVFSQLEKLEKGDTIYANYKGKRYTYTVTRKDTILPVGQWQTVIQPTEKPMLVMVTCWPLGTTQKRLLITAEQVSPDPATATTAPSSEMVETTEGMVGNAPTLLERIGSLFGN